MNTTFLILMGWFVFFLNMPFSMANGPTAALRTLLKVSNYVPERLFTQGTGWAVTWGRQRAEINSPSNAWQKVADLPELEADALIARTLDALEGERLLLDLEQIASSRELPMAGDIHAGGFSTRGIWFQLFKNHGESGEFVFAGTTPQEALRSARVTRSPPHKDALPQYAELFRNGSVRRIIPPGEDSLLFRARLGKKEVSVRPDHANADDYSLTLFNSTLTFSPNESGVAVLGQRFRVGLGAENIVFFNNGQSISVFRAQEIPGGTTVLKETNTRLVPPLKGNQIITFTDQVGLAGEIIGVVKNHTSGTFRIVVWNPTAGARSVLGGALKPRAESPELRFSYGGPVITGVRYTPFITSGGTPLISLELLTQNGPKSVYFRTTNLQPYLSELF